MLLLNIKFCSVENTVASDHGTLVPSIRGKSYVCDLILVQAKTTLLHKWGLNHVDSKARVCERSPHEGDTGLETPCEVLVVFQ